MFILKKENKVTPSLFFLVEYLGPKHKILVTVCPPRTYARTAGKTHLVKSLKQNLHFQKGPKKDPDFLSVAVIRFYWSINFQCWASLFLFQEEIWKIILLRCSGVLVKTVSPCRSICFLSRPLPCSSDGGTFFMLQGSKDKTEVIKVPGQGGRVSETSSGGHTRPA